MSDPRSVGSMNSPVKRGSPSSSQEFNAESPIKSRLARSFWKKRKVIDEESKSSQAGDIEFLNIIDLKSGKAHGKAFAFRVSLIGHVSNASGGAADCLKFHGLDSTGDIAVFVYNTARNIAKLIKVNGVFKLENFDVRPENPQFPQHTGISLQVVMNENSVIEEWSSEGFPGIPFRFVAISEVTDGKIDVNARVDILGIIAEDFGLESTRNGKNKRDIRLTDMQKTEVLLTLWEESAETFNGAIGSAIALRKAVVKDFNGVRLLNAMRGTLIWVDPDLSDNRAQEMVEWFQKEIQFMEDH